MHHCNLCSLFNFSIRNTLIKIEGLHIAASVGYYIEYFNRFLYNILHLGFYIILMNFVFLSVILHLILSYVVWKSPNMYRCDP